MNVYDSEITEINRMFGWYITLINLSENILQMEKIGNLDLEAVLGWLVILGKENEMIKLKSKGNKTDIAF